MTEAKPDTLDLLVDQLSFCHFQDMDHCQRSFDRLRARRLIAEWFYNKQAEAKGTEKDPAAEAVTPPVVAPPAPSATAGSSTTVQPSSQQVPQAQPTAASAQAASEPTASIVPASGAAPNPEQGH